MGRIQDELNRRTVVNFVEMMRIRSKFKAHMSRKHSARMTGIPQMDVPEIFIENEEDREAASDAGSRPGISRQTTAETTVVTSPTSPSALSPTSTHNTNPFLSAREARTSAPSSPTGQISTNPFLSAAESANAQHHSWTGVPGDLSTFDSVFRPDDAQSGSYRTQGSAYSFELHDPDGGGGSGVGSNRSSRRGSSVRPEQVTEMLNSSVWMDSIRRSATLRQRPGHGGSEGAWRQWQ